MLDNEITDRHNIFLTAFQNKTLNNKIINFWNLKLKNFKHIRNDILNLFKLAKENSIKIGDFEFQKIISNKNDKQYIISYNLYESLLEPFCLKNNCIEIKKNISNNNKHMIKFKDYFKDYILNYNKKIKNNSGIYIKDGILFDDGKLNNYQKEIKCNIIKKAKIKNYSSKNMSLGFCNKHFINYLKNSNVNYDEIIKAVINFNSDQINRNTLKALNKKDKKTYPMLKDKIEEFINNNPDVNLKHLSSEVVWFRNTIYYMSVPYCFEKFSVKNIIFGKEQGKLNGPDFIFEYENKLIGFELFELNKNFISIPKNIKENEKFLNSIEKQFSKNLYLTYDKKLKSCKDKINNKIEKWSKFIKVSYKYIGICLNGEDTHSMDYFRLEIELNKIYNIKGYFILIL